MLFWLQIFGLSRVLKDSNTTNYYYSGPSPTFPLKWTCPEATKTKKFDKTNDVWAYGVCLYEIYTDGEEPYYGIANHDVLDRIENGYRLKLKLPVEPISELMEKCFEMETAKRPTSEEIYIQLKKYCQEHEFVTLDTTNSFNPSDSIDETVYYKISMV